ncbi:hypothetical protein BDW74DRAFT_34048 [Aspergillus multicolor]|uniref:uncharacterized protein n=1 Tax=Aspergillus multicolor TaxID=41759 RepID=UPI003CCCEDD1
MPKVKGTTNTAAPRSMASIPDASKASPPTQTCPKCRRAWTLDHYLAKGDKPTKMCKTCREVSRVSHIRRRAREAQARTSRQARPEADSSENKAQKTARKRPAAVGRAVATPRSGAIERPAAPTPLATHAAPSESPSEDNSPGRILKQGLLHDANQSMAAQPELMEPNTSYHEPAVS